MRLTLWLRPRAGHLDSAAAFPMFPGFLRNYPRLREHRVSCPIHQYFRRFLYEYGYFQTHCVSRRQTINPDLQRVRHRSRWCLGFRQSLPQPLLSVVAAIPPVPLRAPSPVTLSLALRPAAHPLSTTTPSVWQEPSATDTTWTLPTHSTGVSHRSRRAN